MDEAPITKPGSSPLTRGTLRIWNDAKFERSVHPRLRGELQRFLTVPIRLVRFIPAYAGNSTLEPERDNPNPVHPRLRGELNLFGSRRDQSFGSSPLTRGTLSAAQLRYRRDRFIPAYAGNSRRSIQNAPGHTVHPRLRGELEWIKLTKPTGNRFIPAYAGNSSDGVQLSAADLVHPRLRGELTVSLAPSVLVRGSSPLTRGTQAHPATSSECTRFIPAYAGNSLKQGIEHLTNSSKDFLSGKYAKNPETVLNHFKNSSLD